MQFADGLPQDKTLQPVRDLDGIYAVFSQPYKRQGFLLAFCLADCPVVI